MSFISFLHTKKTSRFEKFLCIFDGMKITNKEVLAAFARKHADVVNPLNKWIDTVEDNMFRNHHEIKALFPSAYQYIIE